MLTRAGVAKRLGKSIATVRRLEHVELHPLRDARGVFRFREEEVERVARRQARPSGERRAHSAPLRLPPRAETEGDPDAEAAEAAEDHRFARSSAEHDSVFKCNQGRLAHALSEIEEKFAKENRLLDERERVHRARQAAYERDQERLAAAEHEYRTRIQHEVAEFLDSLTRGQLAQIDRRDLEEMLDFVASEE